MTAITATELDALYKSTKARVKDLGVAKLDFADKCVDMAWEAEEEAKACGCYDALRVMWLNEAARRWAQASACYTRNALEHLEYTDAAARCRQEAERVERFWNAQ